MVMTVEKQMCQMQDYTDGASTRTKNTPIGQDKTRQVRGKPRSPSTK